MIINQLMIFFIISFLSEIISNILPFTFPASLMSMVILFILLSTKILSIDKIEKVGVFLQKNIALFFIPPSISLVDEFPYIKDKILPILFISLISFLLTFFSTLYTANLVTKIQERIKKNGRYNK